MIFKSTMSTHRLKNPRCVAMSSFLVFDAAKAIGSLRELHTSVCRIGKHLKVNMSYGHELINCEISV